MCKILDIVIIGYSDNLAQNSMSPGLSLYPICTVYRFHCILKFRNNRRDMLSTAMYRNRVR